MLMHEHFPMLVDWEIRIEGTDLCSEVVERAQAGRYHRIEINRGLPARFVVRYFDHVGEDWVIKPEVRRDVQLPSGEPLRAHAALHHVPLTRFDIIFLRNVMLYFSHETRKTLLAGIHRLLAPDGILFLGSSEQPADPSIWNADPRRRHLLLHAEKTIQVRPTAAEPTTARQASPPQPLPSSPTQKAEQMESP